MNNTTVDTNQRYYISGSDIYPNAIIGLNRDYRIDPQTHWREVEMNPEVMRTIVQNMKEKTAGRTHFLYGFDLLDTAGRPIGVWYSIQTARTCMQIKEHGIVRIDTPDLDTYDHLNGGTRRVHTWKTAKRKPADHIINSWEAPTSLCHASRHGENIAIRMFFRVSLLTNLNPTDVAAAIF